jgi:rhodanese-related sulfurtransferase
MKYLKQGLFYFLIGFLAISCQGQAKKAAVLSPEQFNQKLAATSEKILLDVRTPEEYAEGHLADAKLINYYNEDFKNQLSQLDKSKPVFLYCRSGKRSGASAELLVELGFKEVYDLQGGFMAWADGKYPFIKE